MNKNDFIFVYGTLRSGERADLRKSRQHFSVAYIGTDSINGLLYHLGGYPGVKLLPKLTDYDSNEPVVHGEVFRIIDTSIMAVLDAYEGYPNLYDRSQVPAASGRTVWVYTYPHPTTTDQLIESGDWVRNKALCTGRAL